MAGVRVVLDLLLGGILAAGFFIPHLSRRTSRPWSSPRGGISRGDAREVAVQLPFVYGVGGLVIALAEQVRRSRAASDRDYQRAKHLARFDALTDLPNRTLLRDRLAQALATTRRSEAHLALLVMDLDRLKEVNRA
jgi:predicted signal transduction protein with EAL and GGDEF domain